MINPIPFRANFIDITIPDTQVSVTNGRAGSLPLKKFDYFMSTIVNEESVVTTLLGTMYLLL